MLKIPLKYYRLFTIAWVIMITVLSLTPGKYIPPPPFELIKPDTLAHFVFYAVLAFPLLVIRLLSSKKIFFLGIILIVSGYGFLIEIVQYFVPGRFFDWHDAVINALGSVSGAIFFHFIYGKYNKPTSL